MRESDWLGLAEAVADGAALDWRSLAQEALTPDERAAVRAFRDLAGIGEVYATLASSRGKPRTRPELRCGTTWGGLRVLEHVGSGRFGDVYRAWDPSLERHVALKVLNGDDTSEAADGHVVEEGRLMARVRHPNVAAIHGAQRIDGVTGLWMEFVEGRTIAEELAEQGPFGAEALVRVGVQICHALAAVHAAGLVHRDVKASNVLRDGTGRIVLGDFGTGRELDEPTETLQGLAGTPAYLAPEIFARQPATPRSDLYSLGVLLFHLATREYPYPARSLRALRDAHVVGERPRLSERRPDLPPRLTRVVDAVLEPDPDRRPDSASSMAEALEACLDEQPRRHRRMLWAGALAAALLVAVVAWIVWRVSAPPFSLAERDWVLVAAFDNRTGNPVLDGSLEYALELELGDSSFVGVAPRERIGDVLALMRKPADTRVDDALGLEIAVRDGLIRAVLAGQVARIGTTYQITARILNPGDRAIVASVAETAADDGALLEAIGRLARRVRARLGETLPNLPRDGQELPKVSTRSLKALQFYAQALPDLQWDANPKAARELLLAAVREDPDFAVAYASLGRALYSERFLQGIATLDPRLKDEILGYLDRAIALTDHASVEDRYIVTIESESIRADLSKEGRLAHLQHAREAAQALHQLHPEDVRVVMSLVALNRDTPERLATAKALAALRPNSLDAMKRMANAAADAGESDGARAYLARARRLLDVPVEENRGDGPAFETRMLLFEDAWRRNDMPEAVAMAAALEAMIAGEQPDLQAAAAEQMVPIYLTLGQFARAEQAANAILRPGPKKRLMASVVVRSGKPGRAREVLARMFPNSSPIVDPNPPDIFAELALAAGDVRLARRGVDAVRATATPPGFVQRLEGRLALLEGQPDRAIEKLEPLCASHPDHTMARQCTLLAESLAQAGTLPEAIGVLERMSAVTRELRRPGLGLAADWLTMRDRLAQFYREAGRVTDAEPIEAELRLLLSVGDEDHPIRKRLDSIARHPEPGLSLRRK